MIFSASDLSSSGLSGAVSRVSSSPFTRIVAGRPTLSSRSDALRWTICVIADLKLKVAWPVWGASGMRVYSEKGLSELDGLGVLHQHLPDDTGDLGFDFVHDLHRLDDAHDLPRRHPTARLDVYLGARLGSGVERAHHRRLDLEQLGRRSHLPPPAYGLRGGRRGRGAGDVPRLLRPDHLLTAGAGPVPPPGHPGRRPGPEQTPADLDRTELGRLPQDLHQLGDDVEVHVSQSRRLGSKATRPPRGPSARRREAPLPHRPEGGARRPRSARPPRRPDRRPVPRHPPRRRAATRGWFWTTAAPRALRARARGRASARTRRRSRAPRSAPGPVRRRLARSSPRARRRAHAAARRTRPRTARAGARWRALPRPRCA